MSRGPHFAEKCSGSLGLKNRVRLGKGRHRSNRRQVSSTRSRGGDGRHGILSWNAMGICAPVPAKDETGMGPANINTCGPESSHD